ncbi:hypothetical protein CHISP_2276 [Chitinispirillum alkaliphilum]|nr:hypothetical protein CHISP_2276 [Chitinispirillum alkaliphilum]
MKKVFRYLIFLILLTFITFTGYAICYLEQWFWEKSMIAIAGGVFLSIFLISPIWSFILRKNLKKTASARKFRYSFETGLHLVAVLFWSFLFNGYYTEATRNIFPLTESFHREVENLIHDFEHVETINMIRSVRDKSKIPFERYSAAAFSAGKNRDPERVHLLNFSFMGRPPVWPSRYAALAYFEQIHSPEAYDSLWGDYLPRDEFVSIVKHYLQPSLNLNETYKLGLSEVLLKVAPEDSLSIAITESREREKHAHRLDLQTY